MAGGFKIADAYVEVETRKDKAEKGVDEFDKKLKSIKDKSVNLDVDDKATPAIAKIDKEQLKDKDVRLRAKTDEFLKQLEGIDDLTPEVKLKLATDAARKELAAFDSQIISQLRNVDMKVDVDTAKAKAEIRAVGDSAKPIEVPVEAETSKAKKTLSGLGEMGTSIGDQFSGGMVSSLKGGLVVAAAAIGAEVASAIADKISEGKQIQRALELQFQVPEETANRFRDLFDTSMLEDFASYSGLNELWGGTDKLIKGLEDAGRGAQELASTAVMMTQNFSNLGDVGDAEIRALTVEMERAAQIGGVDVVQAMKGADNASRAFGLNAWDATQLVKRGFVEMGARGDDWAETLQEYSPFFKRLGLTANDTFNAINTGIQHGARNTDILADSFKELSLRVVDGSSLSRSALQDLGLDVEATMEAFGKGGESARAATDAVIDKLNQVQDPVERNRLGVALMGTQWEDAAKDVLQFMNILPGTTDALNRQGFQAEYAKERARGLKDAVVELKQPFTDAATLADRLTDAMDRMNGKVPSLRDAAQAWNDLTREFSKQQDWDSAANGVQRLSGSLVDLKGEVNTTTEAGSRLEDWARNSQLAFNDSAAAMRDAGIPADQMTSKLNVMRDAFVNNAVAQGLPREAAIRLANAYGMVPSQVSTAIHAPGLWERMGELDMLRGKVEQLPDGRFTVIAETADARGNINRLVTDYEGKVIHLRVSAGGVYTNVSGGGQKFMAEGGPVSGPGTDTSDDVPIMASDDEYVVKAKAARKNRDFLDWINFEDGEIQKLATGGPVRGIARRSMSMPGPTPVGIVQNIYPAPEMSLDLLVAKIARKLELARRGAA